MVILRLILQGEVVSARLDTEAIARISAGSTPPWALAFVLIASLRRSSISRFGRISFSKNVAACFNAALFSFGEDTPAGQARRMFFLLFASNQSSCTDLSCAFNPANSRTSAAAYSKGGFITVAAAQALCFPHCLNHLHVITCANTLFHIAECQRCP